MNKNVIGSLVSLVVGTAVGVIGGYFYAKNKFLEEAEKEIASVKKVYEKHFNNISPAQVSEGEQVNKPFIKETPSQTSTVDQTKKEYKKYASVYSSNEENNSKIGSIKSTIKTSKSSKKPVKTPYVITPEEFQLSEYKSETLIWYSDKILADDNGNIIHNVNEVVGPEALSTFGRYLDDTVYVKDDTKKIDYEIIWDARKYASVNKFFGDDTLSEDSESTD